MTHVSNHHRGAGHRRSRHLPTRRTMTAWAVGGVLLTAGAVGTQTIVGASSDEVSATPRVSSIGEPPLATDSGENGDVSRDSERAALSKNDDATSSRTKRAEKAASRSKKAESIRAAQEDPRSVAENMVADRGWGPEQFSCLDLLWVGESNWDYKATNPSSGAYGIPQSLPANKMATTGSDWKTNPITQIQWGLDYISASYGTPCAAQGFKSGAGWY